MLKFLTPQMRKLAWLQAHGIEGGNYGDFGAIPLLLGFPYEDDATTAKLLSFSFSILNNEMACLKSMIFLSSICCLFISFTYSKCHDPAIMTTPLGQGELEPSAPCLLTPQYTKHYLFLIFSSSKCLIYILISSLYVFC
jgi:hypothetical protein